MKSFFMFISYIVLLTGQVRLQAADTLRICTYNLLNYSMSNEDGRTQYFRAIMDEIQPDVLLAQEVVEQESAFKFFQEALQPIIWSLSPFTDGPDSDNMLFFRSDLLSYIDEIQHPTALRNISEYRLLLKSTQDTLHLFSLHLKAGDQTDETEARAAEAQILQNRILNIYENNNDAKIVVAGDFNIYSTAETAYARLLNSATSLLVDPLNGWERNTAEFAGVYTQSTRVAADANCGGGVTGGLDDRFDMILYSTSLMAHYVDGSYTTFGNDGLPRLNDPINDPPNTAVSGAMADALRCASDHLPIFADFAFSEPTSTPEIPLTVIGGSVYPLPVTDRLFVRYRTDEPEIVAIHLMDQLGNIVQVFTDQQWSVGEQALQLPMEVSSGCYYLLIKTHETQRMEKVVVYR